MRLGKYDYAVLGTCAIIVIAVMVIVLNTASKPEQFSAASVLVEPHYRQAKVLRVIDGDTIECSIDLASKQELGSVIGLTTSARLYGINSPDIKDGVAKTKASTENLNKLIATHCSGGQFNAELKGRDKYGRILIIIWAHGINLNQQQIDQGFAIQYMP